MILSIWITDVNSYLLPGVILSFFIVLDSSLPERVQPPTGTSVHAFQLIDLPHRICPKRKRLLPPARRSLAPGCGIALRARMSYSITARFRVSIALFHFSLLIPAPWSAPCEETLLHSFQTRDIDQQDATEVAGVQPAEAIQPHGSLSGEVELMVVQSEDEKGGSNDLHE